MSASSLSETIDRRAETLRLAQLLGCDAAELPYLADVASSELRVLRVQVTETLYGGQSAVFAKLAAASKLLPVGLVAQLAERSFGPLLSARIAGLLEPERAVELAARLPVGFLASLAVELDPRRAEAVIALIPPGQIAEISAELTARREYVTMGRFVAAMPEASIRAAIGEMDARTMLEVSLVVDGKERLGQLVGMIDPARFDAMIAAAADAELVDEALTLLAYLGEEARARVLALPELHAYRAAS